MRARTFCFSPVCLPDRPVCRCRPTDALPFLRKLDSSEWSLVSLLSQRSPFASLATCSITARWHQRTELRIYSIHWQSLSATSLWHGFNILAPLGSEQPAHVMSSVTATAHPIAGQSDASGDRKTPCNMRPPASAAMLQPCHLKNRCCKWIELTIFSAYATIPPL